MLDARIKLGSGAKVTKRNRTTASRLGLLCLHKPTSCLHTRVLSNFVKIEADNFLVRLESTI